MQASQWYNSFNSPVHSVISEVDPDENDNVDDGVADCDDDGNKIVFKGKTKTENIPIKYRFLRELTVEQITPDFIVERILGPLPMGRP
jgi:hypothetical protein